MTNSLRVLIAGGVFRLSPEEIARRQPAPELNLARGLAQRGIEVRTTPLEALTRIAVPRGASVVHVHHASKGALVAAFSPWCQPLVFTAHQTGLPVRPTRRIGLLHIVRRADATVCLSDDERDEKAALVPSARDRLHVIPNGMAFAHDGVQRRRLRDGEPFRVLFVGQLIPLKAVDRLIRALCIVPRMTLRLVYHNAALEPELQLLAQQLGVSGRVTFVGQADPEQLQREYAAAHVLALPSRHEALPSAVTEALSTGLPVIASNTGGIAGQLGGAGLLTPPDDDVAAARAIAGLAGDYEDFARAAEARADVVRTEYSLDRMVDAHIALYESLASRS